MKNIILGSVLAIAAVTSLSANAAAICSGTAAGDGTSVTVGSFVKVGFTPKCSANVFLDGIDSTSTLYVVAAGSAKGKKIFAGSTAGGSVSPFGADCAASGCTSGEVTTAAGAAETAAAGTGTGT
ncbi:MAG: hypothetical protein IPK44_05625 [Candidatus Accumulibacter sp.]|uniref:hypothetical protein n=1 Tax=Accumulibacter sp. TaxID=2053492 RepID=UPI00258B0D84|nr:hypothetical protein [Accumulibacter sp.]MBK8114045.1 hypothetical protein [Accumulibacter sp.]